MRRELTLLTIVIFVGFVSTVQRPQILTGAPAQRCVLDYSKCVTATNAKKRGTVICERSGKVIKWYRNNCWSANKALPYCCPRGAGGAGGAGGALPEEPQTDNSQLEREVRSVQILGPQVPSTCTIDWNGCEPPTNVTNSHTRACEQKGNSIKWYSNSCLQGQASPYCCGP